MSARMEKTRLTLTRYRDSLMEWFAPEDGDPYPAFGVDAALSEVEEWEKHRSGRERNLEDAYREAGSQQYRAEAAEAERDRLREAAAMRVAHGHNDTCGVAVSPGMGYPCSCGHDDLAAALNDEGGQTLES